ncbi:MAG TPA: multicopper oxidase domain-containing protein [Longimicrobium sp.]|jgi:FtsP/CotA-like multicopper oxidase with cupredoxin domain|uniref:multicopper oxidase family protein n=1 Tax=Longimicrobium sp. TaxID=2029185 RepID=UPI002EDADE3B
MPDPRHLRPPPRRSLPALLGVAAFGAAMIAAACAPGTGTPGRAEPVVRRPVAGAALMYQDSLRSPLEVRSMNGVLSATLDVSFADLPVTRYGTVTNKVVLSDTLITDTLPLRTYTLAATTDTAYRANDPRFTPRYPGPTFRVRPGDLVQIWLRNKLPPPTRRDERNDVCMTYPAADISPDSVKYPRDHFQDCFHGPNYTNIHYHGMHVTPDSTSTAVGDDVLMVIAPGDSILYSFRVPLNQSPGTHWYHPHKHGSVALQVANGMAGAFIVEDPATGLDRFTQRHNLRQHLIGFQQIDTTVGLFHGDTTNILDKVPPLVNGQNSPVIYMAPGEVQRWRIVNENVTRNTKTLEFRFEDLPGHEPVVVEVARDGVQFSPANMARDVDPILLMGAGNRLDVIVQAPLTPGTHHFRLRHLPGASRRSRDPALPPQTLEHQPTESLRVNDANAFLLFRVVVDSSRRASSTGLPASIPNLASFLGTNVGGPPAFLGGTLRPARDSALIVFTDTGSPGNFQKPAQFFLGGGRTPFQRFDDDVVFVPSNAAGRPMPMILDSTQTWKVVNNSAIAINHPFHIHINPFQVNSVVYFAGDPFADLFAELNAASAAGSPIWLDVLPLPLPRADTTYRSKPNGGVDTVVTRVANTGYAVITQRYDPFTGCVDGKCGPPTGEFVMHCHILGHEERGMMQVLEIVGPGGRTRAAGQGGHGAHPAGAGPAAQPQHRH